MTHKDAWQAGSGEHPWHWDTDDMGTSTEGVKLVRWRIVTRGRTITQMYRTDSQAEADMRRICDSVNSHASLSAEKEALARELQKLTGDYQCMVREANELRSTASNALVERDRLSAENATLREQRDVDAEYMRAMNSVCPADYTYTGDYLDAIDRALSPDRKGP